MNVLNAACEANAATSSARLRESAQATESLVEKSDKE
jgi:hypothetical protein